MTIVGTLQNQFLYSLIGKHIVLHSCFIYIRQLFISKSILINEHNFFVLKIKNATFNFFLLGLALKFNINT